MKNVPACRSSPHHGSRTGGPRDNGFKRGRLSLGQLRRRQLSGRDRAVADLSRRPWRSDGAGDAREKFVVGTPARTLRCCGATANLDVFLKTAAAPHCPRQTAARPHSRPVPRPPAFLTASAIASTIASAIPTARPRRSRTAHPRTPPTHRGRWSSTSSAALRVRPFVPPSSRLTPSPSPRRQWITGRTSGPAAPSRSARCPLPLLLRLCASPRTATTPD